MSFDSLAKSFLGFLFSRSMLNAIVVVLGAIVAAYGFRMFLNAVGIKIKKTFWHIVIYLIGFPLWAALGVFTILMAIVAVIVIPFGIVLPFAKHFTNVPRNKLRKSGPRPTSQRFIPLHSPTTKQENHRR